MKSKKIYCYMIVIILVINAPILAYADSAPGTITVSGGSIGSGGIEGNSNILKGTALTVLMATLASVGIQAKLSLEDYQAGNSAINYIGDKFAEWESKANDGWKVYESLNDTKVGQNGELYLSQEGQSVIDRFINWLKSENQVQTPVESNPNVGVGGAYYGNSWTDSSGKKFYFSNNLEGNIVAFQQYSNSPIYFITGFREGPMSFLVKRPNAGPDQKNSTSLDGTNYRYCDVNDKFTTTDIGNLFNISTLGYYGIEGFKSWLRGDPQVPDINLQTGFYGDINDIPSLVDISGTGKIVVIQPGLMPQVQDNYVASNNAVVGVSDYLDALKDLIGQQALPQDITDLPDISITGEDAITGTREDVVVINREVVLNPDITLPADPDAITWPEVPEIAVPVADPTSPSDPDISIPAMSIDLTQYFPFCLPFDIYHILQKLNADPVTPQITVDWGNILGQFGIDYQMHLDLHDYDNLAELLRNMETAAFVVGLAVVTRQMFLRG